ncbi:hypothetical protein GCM10020258_17580 [Sphingomonas yabuuchiae]
MAGKVFTLHLKEQLRHGPVVLYFFPAAFTSGCSAEARAFAEKIDAFRAAGARVIGMSADPVDKLAAFSKAECAGKFPVASAGPAIVKGYDVALGRQIEGRDITSRTSYVIGRDGRVVFVHDDMNPPSMSPRRWRRYANCKIVADRHVSWGFTGDGAKRRMRSRGEP